MAETHRNVSLQSMYMNTVYIPGLDTTTKIVSGLYFTKFGIISEKRIKCLLVDMVNNLTIYTHA